VNRALPSHNCLSMQLFGRMKIRKLLLCVFGMVKIAEHAFLGIANTDFDMEADKRKPAFLQYFSDWQALLTHWKTSIEAIVQEIKAGEAMVRFEDEKPACLL